MGDQNEKPPPYRYKWPWFVLAAFLLGVALAILWMRFEVRKVEQERNVNAPLPGSTAH
jgi:uncharacterized membrane-anchored protein YhcB (DUF1043 family)